MDNNVIYVSNKIDKVERPPFVIIPTDSTVGIEIHKLRMRLKKDTQSKKASLLEAAVNVVSGAIIACIITQLVAPYLDINITGIANLKLTLILTTVSVIRGYLWRRFFNRRQNNV